MDRSKSQSGARGAKGKITQHPPDLFALGKLGSSREIDVKRSVPHTKSSTHPHSTPSSASTSSSSSKVVPGDRKREGTSTSLPIPPSKKPKIAPLRTSPATTGPSSLALNVGADRQSSSTTAQPAWEPWEALVVEGDSCDFIQNITTALDSSNFDKAIGYLLGAIRNLSRQRFKPEKCLYYGLLLQCKVQPSLFQNEHVLAALASVLRRDVAHSFKSKGNPAVPVLAANLLMKAYVNQTNWPDTFVRLYVDDALGDRIWVDQPYNKSFVDNIITAFETKVPPKSLIQPELSALGNRGDSSSPLTITADDDEVYQEYQQPEAMDIPVYQRYVHAHDDVEIIVLEAIKEQLNRRQPPEAVTRNFVRLLSSACGLVEIRVIAVSRLEMWLHNPKLMRPAQELLAYLTYNCSNYSQRDLEVTAQLVKIRLKTKALVNVFNNCLRELILAQPENLAPMLKHTIYNELSNARNPNNMPMLATMFQTAPDAAAEVLAEIFHELLLTKDDYLRSLRALLREIVRVLRFDINLFVLVRSLLRERKDLFAVIRDFEFRDRVFVALVDICCLCMLLAVSPQVRDAASRDKRDPAVLQAFQLQVSTIQKECVTWLHDIAVRLYRPSIPDFVHSLHKLLMLEPAEQYYKVDMWPGESDRTILIRLVSEVPLSQVTLVRVLLIGLSKDHPLSPHEALDLAEQIIRRAASLTFDGVPSLQGDKVEIIDLIFNLAVYHYPENITLPQGYTPPQLAISSLFWKGWIILLILAAHNPSTFGSIGWKKYPMLRTFMEMCITNHFAYPPPTAALSDSIDEAKTKELQLIALEKQQILEFETHLAAASTKITITEQNSLLLPQLIEIRPTGDARRPPQPILDALQSLNATLRLGHLLCRSRHPDFLLDIMGQQGPNPNMPWLAELVHSSEGALAHLPVQCLCEYLLSPGPPEKLRKHGQLLAHLRAVVAGGDGAAAREVLEYLLRRLSSLHGSSRTQAVKGLGLVLAPLVSPEEETQEEMYWLTHHIPLFQHLPNLRTLLINSLRQACLVETEPMRVSSYISFLAAQWNDEPLPDLLELVVDLAQLIVERSSIISCILPGPNGLTLQALMSIFCATLQRAREPHVDAFPWSENQEQVVVTWSSGEQCTLHILVVHASVILLTYGPADPADPVSFQALLELWFPDDKEPPKAFLVDTSEEALLLPDWLKLRMIRSHVSRLVDAALENLEPPQLVLFIQSFGIPVASITKLLSALDRAVMSDPRPVDEAVIDKNYMAQLVEVQHRRGATGGEYFVKVLQLQQPPLPEDVPVVAISNTALLPEIEALPEEDLDIQTLGTLLNLLFLETDFTGKTNLHKEFRCLTKKLSTTNMINERIAKKILEFFAQHENNATFIQSLQNKPQYSAVLCRLLFLKAKDCFKHDIAKGLLNKLTNKSCPVAIILKDYVTKYSASDETVMETDQVAAKPTNEQFVSVARSAELVSKNCSEQVLAQPTGLEKNIAEALLRRADRVEKSGLLVDWLAALELEIASSCQPLQMQLLFSKEELPFRPLLLSLILQRASWRTLSAVVEHLLSTKNDSYCASSVLHFLVALTQSPRLWQGRDKAIPKHYQKEDVLHLNAQQSSILVDYILSEADDSTNPLKCIETRLPLLLQSAKDSLPQIINPLIAKSGERPSAQTLLLMLYMWLPNVTTMLSNPNKKKDSELLNASALFETATSVIDPISHSLLSAMAATPRTKDWTKRSQELELCTRKLASAHPTLIQRQLPMLAGSLRGRAQFDWFIFKSRGHLAFFNQALGLLELLQPGVFDQYEPLVGILDSFFDMLRFHGHMKELNMPLGRLVTFLQQWISKDAARSLTYLQDYAYILNDLQLSQPSVRPLLSTVSLPSSTAVAAVASSSSSDQQQQPPNAPAPLLVGAARAPSPEPLPQHWTQWVTALTQSEDIYQALQELDHLSNRRPGLLASALAPLLTTLTSHSGATRSLAHLLLVRYLKYCPSAGKEAMPALLKCLDSPHADVVASCLDRLPEYAVCCQEYASLLLKKAFRLGIQSNVNTVNSIVKALGVISLQSGC